MLVQLLFSPNIVYFPFGSHELPLWAIVSWIDQLTSSLLATGYCGNPLAIKAITGTPLKSDHQKALLSRAHSLAFKPKFSFKTNNNNKKRKQMQTLKDTSSQWLKFLWMEGCTVCFRHHSSKTFHQPFKGMNERFKKCTLVTNLISQQLFFLWH